MSVFAAQEQVPYTMHMERGRFIALEGGDGAGKDTQVALLASWVEAQGRAAEFLFVRDPGSTEIGQKLRQIVLQDAAVARTTELLIYLAARVQLAEELIRPALAAGKTVVSNRFDLSTIAYQIYGRERLEFLPLVKQMSEFALGGVRPDVVVYLEVPAEVGLARAAKAGALDRFEQEKIAFHERVRVGYRTHLHEYPEHHVIDATGTIDEVHTTIRAALGFTL